MRYLGLTLFIFIHLHIEAQSFRTLSQTKPGIRKDYEKAKLEAQKENTNASIILLLKCLEKDPILVEAWTLLGNAYHDIGEYKNRWMLSQSYPLYTQIMISGRTMLLG